MNVVKEKWDEIIHKLKIEHGLSDVSFKTWIAPFPSLGFSTRFFES